MSSNKSPEEIIEMKKRLKAKQMQKESKEVSPLFESTHLNINCFRFNYLNRRHPQ